MVIVISKVCSICKSAECKGQEYKVNIVDYHEKSIGNKIVCSSQIYERDGKLWHHVVRGHGDTYESEAIIYNPIK